MTTSNVPYLKGSTMADTRTAAEKAAAEREAEQKAAAERRDKADADKLAADKAAAEKAVAEAKTPAEKAAAEKALERVTERVEAQKAAGKSGRRVDLASAGASGDPDVQRLLAQREAHLMNSQPDPSFAAQREAAEQALRDIDDALAELGYTVK